MMGRWGSAALVAGLLACGGRAHAPGVAPEEKPDTSDVSDPIVPVDMPAPETPPDETPPDDGPAPAEVDLPVREFEGDARRILDDRCGACHSHGMDQGGIGDILHLEWLFGDPLLTLPAETTRLILMLRYGDGIAEHTYPFVSEAELLTLIRFIDSVELFRESCGTVSFQPDELQRVLLVDISRYPASDRAFIRYLTPADPLSCGDSRGLLFALMNGTSSAAVAVAPRCDYGYCAIDLRDYGWNQPVDVDADGQPDFDDAWQAALAAVGPYAVQMTGPEAMELSSQTQTPVPVLPAPAFAHGVTTGPLYYALTGASRVSQGLVANLPERAGTLPPDIVRAGILGSNRPDRAVTRHSQSNGGTGAIWTLEELPGTLRQAPVFREFDGAEVMFPLPNGMWAYALSRADGTVFRELPGCIGSCAIRAQSPVTCMACHHQGLLGVVDQMAPLMTTISPSYDSETLAAAQAQYVSAEALAALIDEDNRREADAHASAGTQQGFTNRIPYDVFSFEKPLSLGAAKHELGFATVDMLRNVIVARSGDPRIAPLQPLLERGQVERAVFSAAYETLLCGHEGASNRPAACAP